LGIQPVCKSFIRIEKGKYKSKSKSNPAGAIPFPKFGQLDAGFMESSSLRRPRGGGWDGRAGRRGVVALATGEVMVLWRRRRGGGGGGGTWLRRRGKSRRECVTASREVPLIQSMNVRLPSQLGVSTAAAWRRGRRDAWRRPAGLAEVAGGSAASPGVHVAGHPYFG
jgi:hypothetical protein